VTESFRSNEPSRQTGGLELRQLYNHSRGLAAAPLELPWQLW